MRACPLCPLPGVRKFMFFTMIGPFAGKIVRKNAHRKILFYDARFVLFRRNRSFWRNLFYDAWNIARTHAFLSGQEEKAMSYTSEKMPQAAYCLYCGREMPAGRPDRKFCCVTCKNRYHNRHKYPCREQVEQRIFRILERNHAILDKLLRLGIHSLDLMTLSQLGYNKDYVTSYRKQGIRNEYLCFDVRYELTPSRIKKIVRIGPEDWDADKEMSKRKEAGP